MSEDRQTNVKRATRTLSLAALFLGDQRDGITLLNMQNVFLVTSKSYSEKQAGVMLFVFGLSQFLFQTPAGHLMDSSDRKVYIFGAAVISTMILTLVTVMFAQDYGANLGLMLFVKFVQGGLVALIPPGLNSITQGIVGAAGMTSQVSMNEMMNHLGTAVVLFIGSVIAFVRFPDIGLLFITSPVACIGFIFFLSRIRPGDIDHADARGLSKKEGKEGETEEAHDLSSVIRDPLLVTFVAILFFFHLANSVVLPLVMQTLAISNGKLGILLSALSIAIAQVFMTVTAKVCGTYSGTYGRKPLFIIGLLSLPTQCAILAWAQNIKDGYGPGEHPQWIDNITLSTQILDGIGAGVYGTMYVLVTSDISGGTGRFSLTLGITTAAVCIGGTISGYLGQALAEDLGYCKALSILGIISLIPVFLYVFVMPETLNRKRNENTTGAGEKQPLLTATPV